MTDSCCDPVNVVPIFTQKAKLTPSGQVAASFKQVGEIQGAGNRKHIDITQSTR